MPLFGTIAVWVALVSLVASLGLYLFGRPKLVRWGRAAFGLAAAGVFAAAGTLGALLVTHRFDVAYVYQHSARAMAPLYWFPSFWAGQEGSFLLWAFWVSVLGLVLARTSGGAERRVMPIYGSLLLFLTIMLVVRSPFVMLDTQGMPAPTEGLGLNPNLENYWMVIHPPTLFLGFASLTVPFAFALSALLWRDWDGWLRRALPWGLFGFAVLGLAMMMGGYWAYEMLGWGGFWEWDPVENGPFVPWVCLVAFLHAAQIQRVRGGFQKPTLLLGLLPFAGAMYESFLTRTGILSDFSVHSFSELGGAANNLLIGALLLTVAVSVGALAWRARGLKGGESTLEATGSREFGYTLAILLLTLSGLIAGIGMSAPLLSAGAVKLGWMSHTAAVKEDFYNRAMFPLAVLLAVGLGVGPYLAWAGRGKADGNKLGLFYMLSVGAAVAFVVASRFIGSPLPGARLVPELILFTAAVFAFLANGALLLGKFRRPALGPVLSEPLPSLVKLAPPSPFRVGEEKDRKGAGGTREDDVSSRALLLSSPERGGGEPQRAGGVPRVWTAGGTVSHLGAALLLIGLVCLVTFVHKQSSVFLMKGVPTAVLNGAYTITYRGQTSNYQTDHYNALLFDVAARGERVHLAQQMPFAERPAEGGKLTLFRHPAIAHNLSGDLYLSSTEGPDETFPSGRFPDNVIKLGATRRCGPYALTLVRLDRDPQAAAFVQATRQMPDVFPVWAVLRVAYKGKSFLVRPKFVQYSPAYADTHPVSQFQEEAALPGGWLVSFDKMSAGSADFNNPNAGAMTESATFAIRPPGPVIEAFEVDVSTRPMISFIWLGTLLMFFGGLISMRRRVLENRADPVPDLPASFPLRDGEGGAKRREGSRRTAKRRAPIGEPAPSLATMRKR